MFRKLLQNPADPEINFQIGQKDEQAGRLFRALAAYERGLAANPGDPRFKEAIARVRNKLNRGKTEYTVAFGLQGETNVKREPTNVNEMSDGAASTMLRIKDDSPFPGIDGGLRLETNAIAYLNYHRKWRAGDLGFLGVDSGPTFNLNKASSLRVAPGFSAVFIGENSLYDSGFLRLDYRNSDIPNFTQGTFTLGYDSYGANYSGRGGLVGDIRAQFVYGDVLWSGDALSVTPHYRYQNANSRRYRNQMLEVTASHLTQTAPGFSVGPTLVLKHRRYERADDPSVEGANRKDNTLIPGLQFIASDFKAFDNLTVIGNYKYETNVSNEGAKNYQNHFFGATAAFTF